MPETDQSPLNGTVPADVLTTPLPAETEDNLNDGDGKCSLKQASKETENLTRNEETAVAAEDDSSSSDNSSVSSDSSDKPMLSIIERRAIRIDRNRDVLKSKGFLQDKKTPRKRNSAASMDDSSPNDLTNAPSRGILLPTNNMKCTRQQQSSMRPSVSDLQARYPHRQTEIRKLGSLLLRSHHHQNDSSNGGIHVAIPAPILVTGPEGSGKTSITRDLLSMSGLTVAYVDCNVLDERSIEHVMNSVYRQWEAELAPESKIRKKLKPKKKKARKATNSNAQEYDEDRTERSRTRRRQKQPSQSRRAPRRSSTHHKAAFSSMTQNKLVYTFGRVANNMLQGRGAALVLDNAEQALNLPARKNSSEMQSLLGQLLLLPKVMAIDVTIILITRSVLLGYARLNPLVSMEQTPTSLDGSFNFMQVHFPAYKERNSLVNILSVPDVKFRIVGVGTRENPAIKAAYASCIATIVQYFQDSTNNVKEYIQLARKLWPQYIAPLQNKEGTARKLWKSEDSTPTELLKCLNHHFLPHIRKAVGGQRGFVVGGQSSSGNDMPVMAKLMLISSFLCQVNRPDRDRHLFSIQKNGRRRKDTNGEQARDLAYEVSVAPQPKKLRLKTFPLERMLSVFVSLVGLNPHITGSVAIESRLESMGTTSIFQVLSRLRDMGLVVEPSYSTRDPVRISEPRFTCTLTREEAESIAAGMGFPIERYLL